MKAISLFFIIGFWVAAVAAKTNLSCLASVGIKVPARKLYNSLPAYDPHFTQGYKTLRQPDLRRTWVDPVGNFKGSRTLEVALLLRDGRSRGNVRFVHGYFYEADDEFLYLTSIPPQWSISFGRRYVDGWRTEPPADSFQRVRFSNILSAKTYYTW